MSNNFNDQLTRMKVLMTYGNVNEDTKHISSYNIEYKAQAADGKYYGIIRENSKYFVKVATPGKEMIAEEYQYIGGINNKSNYEYTSYANALKHFELKLGSINEAYDENRKVNVEALDPFKKEDLVIEGTEKMKDEIARQRQIMRNASVIMNEATEIGSTPFKTQPEAEKENSGDKDYPFVKNGDAKPEGDIKFDNNKPETAGSPFAKNADVEDYDLDNGKSPKVDNSVASETPKGGKVVKVNESVEECNVKAEGCGMTDECGDFNEDVDDELNLDAEEEPMGEPVDSEEDDVEIEDSEEVEDEPSEYELDGEDEDEFTEDDYLDFGEDDDEIEDTEDEFEDEENFDGEDETSEIEADDEEESDEPEFGEDFEDDEEGFENDEETGEFGDEDFEDEESDEIDDEDFEDEEDREIELDENVVKGFRKLVRESIREVISKRAMANKMNEAKAAKMNSIVESVVKDILAEDELHVFGDHPGYRKKPMTLPPTGEDRFQDNKDWNDESVYSEEPFGKGKGNSTPFDELVAKVTDSIMKQISEDKKKVK